MSKMPTMKPCAVCRAQFSGLDYEDTCKVCRRAPRAKQAPRTGARALLATLMVVPGQPCPTCGHVAEVQKPVADKRKKAVRDALPVADKAITVADSVADADIVADRKRRWREKHREEVKAADRERKRLARAKGGSDATSD